MKTTNIYRAVYATMAAVGITVVTSAFSQTTNWVAINDHHRGTTSSPYANFYNPLLNDAGLSGPLTNTVAYAVLPQGARTPASINITTNGASSQAGAMGAPAAGTPAGNWFLPYVNFGSGNRDAIQLSGTSTITYTFTGLDPVKKYIFKGTAARGNNYYDRWTVATINGANSFTHSHQPTWAQAPGPAPNYGVLTASDTTSLAANQAAWNSGENRATGAMIVFTDIDPGPDGTFSITVATYHGTVPNGQSTAGQYGYAFSAFSLEEINVVVGPPQITAQPPATITINEAETLTISVGVSGGVTFQWYHGTTPMNPALNPTATNATLVITNVSINDAGNYYLYVANQYGQTNSSIVNVTVIQDTVRPTITGALGLLLATNLPPQQPYTLTHILVTFSEGVTPESATVPGNYEVYTMGNPTNQLTVYSAQMVSPSNVLLTTSPRVYLQNYTLRVNNIVDRSPSHPNTILPNSTFDIWHELNLMTFTDDDIFAPTNNWKYDESGTDHGPYWYTNSADFFAGWMDGWELFAAKSGGMPTYIPELVRSQLTPPDVNRVRTYYFWRTFDFPAGADPKVAELRLRYIVDDGAVFYLNKHEVYSIRMPTNRPIYFTNLASAAPAGPGDAPVYEPTTNATAIIQPYFVLPNDYLQRGLNELAVEVHQSSDTSSDMYLGVVLTAIVPPIGQAVKPRFVLGPTPTNTVTRTGTNFVLTVEAVGTEPIYYSWYFVKTNTTTWTLIPGQNTPTLTINNITTNNNGAYYAVAANAVGAVTSTPAFLTVVPPPVITTQPQSVTTNVGANVTFTVTATGIPPLSYQWYWNNLPISGANSMVLTLQNVQAYQAGPYYVVVSDVGGSTTSQVAQLILPPDTIRPTILMALGLLRATNYPPTQPPSLTDILITFSEPVDPATATNIANYRVDRYDGGQNLPIARALLINATNVLLTTTVPRTLYTNYTLTVNNVTDLSPNRNPIVPNTKFDIYLELPLVYYGPTNDISYAWKFDYSGTDYSGQFYQVGFDDSAWTNCWMLVEGKRGTVPALPEPIGTLLPGVDTANYIYTYYFRKHFYFPFGIDPRLAELRLRHVIDDGAIFYMNGNEFYSIRMPATPRPMTWNTQANGSVGDATYNPATDANALIQPYYVVTNAYLTNGDNVIAVEVHQNGTSSSDITFGMILTAVVPPIGVPARPPQIVTHPQSVTTNFGATVEFSVEASGVIPLNYQWYHNNLPLSGANSATLIITNVQSYHGGSYFVVVSNLGGSVTSQVATLTLPQDTVPPTLLMAVGILRATNYPPTQMPSYTDILLTFSEPLDPVSAQNVANYTVTKQGGGQLQVVNAVLVNMTNVLIQTATPREAMANYIVRVTNVKDASVQANPIVPTDFTIYQELPLIYIADTNHYWKYDISRTDWGTNWMAIDFDDSGWTNGLALFEAKRGTIPALPEPIMTLLPAPINDSNLFVHVYYYRTHFTVPDGVNVNAAQVYLRHIVDDGAVFYLNGKEIFAVNMPTNRPITYNDSALAAVGDATYEPPVAQNAVVQPAYLITNANLKIGDNLMAVEVHQSAGTGSSDHTFGMILTAVVPPFGGVTPPPVRVTPPILVNNKIRFSFATESGWTYYLEATPGLEVQNLNWTAVTSVQGDGTVKTLEDNVIGGRKFYRLRAVKQ
ncbi:MAG: immunoglobulin domain-containing protein [Verrucomicrobiia bacterium]